MPSKGAFVACKIDKHKINAHISRHIEEVSLHVITQLAYIGEECVRIARQGGTYKDRTGNLRSSIGYVILRDGQPIIRGQERQYKDGTEGAGAAETLLGTLRGEFPKGIVLIVCAGMKYAAYVEEIHHRDVLASAELTAKSLARQLLNGIIT